MTVETRCECGFLLRALDQYEGKVASCPKCKARVKLVRALPLPEPIPEPVVEESDEIPAFTPNISTVPKGSPATAVDNSDNDDWDDAEDFPEPSRSARETRAVEASLPTPADFRRNFLGVLIVSIAYRVIAGLVMVGGTIAAIGYGIVAIAGAAQQNGGGLLLMILAIGSMSVSIISTAVVCGVLWMCAELMTAAAWFFLKHGVGGNGLAK